MVIHLLDTIPAMLTDGEFVLNKEATAMYGPIIEQMNNHGLQQRHAENQMLKAATLYHHTHVSLQHLVLCLTLL